MNDSKASGGSGALKVKVDGEEAILHITGQSVMFENGGRVSGFEKSAIRMVKPDGDAMIIAYSVGSEVKSVQVEPMTAVASLLMPISPPSAGANEVRAPTSTGALDEVFERLYRDTRKELEERLAKVQEEPEDKSLRLTPEEEAKYSQVSRQMENTLGNKYGFNPQGEDNPISFWGLEKQPFELQLDVVRIRHIRFLRMIVGPRADTADRIYATDEVWPDDLERILAKFKLSDQPLLSASFKSYLMSHWKYSPSDRKPALTRS